VTTVESIKESLWIVGIKVGSLLLHSAYTACPLDGGSGEDPVREVAARWMGGDKSVSSFIDSNLVIFMMIT
jgi:hypothetical protein